MKIINLFGAPSAGKSTAMLGLTYQMKMMGLSVENTPEFFKEMIYEDGKADLFGGQLYVLGEQNRRIARLVGKNDFAVTDCPLPLIGFYTSEDYVLGFKDFVKNLNDKYNNINYLILRKHEFENEKRVHGEDAAKKIEEDLPIYLNNLGINYKTFESSSNLVEDLINDLIKNNIITKDHLINSRNPDIRSKYQ